MVNIDIANFDVLDGVEPTTAHVRWDGHAITYFQLNDETVELINVTGVKPYIEIVL